MKAKKLIHEDTKALVNIQDDLKKIRPILVGILLNYERLEIGDFNNEVFTEIKNRGLRKLERKYLLKMEGQIKKAGITSSLVIKNLMNGSNEIFQELKVEVSKALSFNNYYRRFGDNTPFIKLEMIDYVGGSFMITEETEAKFIENHCKVYLETDQENKIYDAANKFMDGFKELISELEAVGYRSSKDVNAIVHYFFRTNDGQYNLKPHSIKSAIQQNVIYEKRQKEFGHRAERMTQIAKERQERFK
tara:strand:- start:11671 stop:12411 length:741 start_codon:yes stop_codon:yes gene_type:complete